LAVVARPGRERYRGRGAEPAAEVERDRERALEGARPRPRTRVADGRGGSGLPGHRRPRGRDAIGPLFRPENGEATLADRRPPRRVRDEGEREKLTGFVVRRLRR